VLLSEFLLFSDDDIQLVFLTSDFSLNLSYLMGQIFALSSLVAAGGSIGACFSFVLFGLSLNVVEGDLAFVDLIVQASKFVLGLLGIFSLVFKFSNQFLVVIFSLMQSFVQLGIDRLIVPDCSLEVLQFVNIGVQKGVESIAFFLQSFALIFESFELNRRGSTVMAKCLFYSLVL